MKIYSDTLTADDIYAAMWRARVTLDVPLYLHSIDELPRVRLRARGWQVKLANSASWRTFNPGNGNSRERERGAATYDQWGQFLAELFAADPHARANGYSIYEGLDGFNAVTGNRYQAAHSCPFCTTLKGR